MKRFAVEEDRDFEIGGEVFRWIYPYWEDIAKVFDADTAEMAAEPTNGDEALGTTVRDTIADFIVRIQLFIDPDFNDGITRWKALTKRKKNPIPHSQYAELYRWLLEVSSAPVPTAPASPLEDGQPQTVAT